MIVDDKLNFQVHPLYMHMKMSGKVYFLNRIGEGLPWAVFQFTIHLAYIVCLIKKSKSYK
jgi:hypothetical protein